MATAEKDAMVQELGGQLTQTNAAFLVGYEGINCADLTSLRRQLRKSGAHMAVVKNTLVKRAIVGTKAEKLTSHLEGANAVIWAKEDPIAPAKVISDFAKGNEKLTVKAGYIDGVVVAAADVQALASMPSKPEVQAKLLALINTPAIKLLQMISAPGASLARVIEAHRKKMEGNA